MSAWIAGLARRRGARLAATAAGIAVAVAMLASIGSFLSASKQTMTRQAAQSVPVDWQVQLQPAADLSSVLPTVRASGGVRAVEPVGYGSTTGLQAATAGTTQVTGPGVVLGLPSTYATTFPGEIRYLVGAHEGVLVAQQTAANLHVGVGDVVAIGRAGLPPVDVRVDGVVDLPQADSLFQRVGAPVGSQPQTLPDNVVVLPLTQWHSVFDVLGSSRRDLVHTQVHVRLNRPALPTDPTAAYTAVTQAAHHLELRLAGAGLVGDNLGATLAAARSDALYAQVLFLFLGTPGALIAGMLTAAVAAAAGGRRRQEQGLLRARGATTSQLVSMGAAEAILVGAAGIVGGLGLAAAIGQLAFGTVAFGASAGTAAGWSIAAAIAGLAIAGLTIAVPAWRDARSLTVASARRVVGRPRTPLWARLGVDLWLLAASGVVFWLSSRGGYQLVLAPEGTPSISVSYWAFAGPLLLWAGAGLLTWRLSYLVLHKGRRPLGRAVRPLARGLSSTVAGALARQRSLLARAVVLVALALAFAASTAIFNSTFRQQSEVDTRLTSGGDVTVTEPPTANTGSALRARLAALPGVRHVEPLQHRFAYVGADLQDLYGVRPSTVVSATSLQDAYFQGGTASQLMQKLAVRHDGILVSAETVRDFQLAPGDTLRLRLLDTRTNRLVHVRFHYVGIVQEFPTAPKDSFLVANATYVANATGSGAIGEYLINAGDLSPVALAGRVRAVVGGAAQVTDVQTTRNVVGSSLTAVDLSGLTRVELGFAVALVAAATGLVLALGLAERRRTFAIAAALGAKGRQLGAFVWSEAGFVAVAGLVSGALVGWLLSEMLVKVLTGVFDPPPAALAVPWFYLAGAAVTAGASTMAAAIVSVRRSRTSPLSVLREL